MFERFFQGRAGQALGSGSGLGLAIVAGVARRHGGAARVSAREGGGSFGAECERLERLMEVAAVLRLRSAAAGGDVRAAELLAGWSAEALEELGRQGAQEAAGGA